MSITFSVRKFNAVELHSVLVAAGGRIGTLRAAPDAVSPAEWLTERKAQLLGGSSLPAAMAIQ